MATPVVMPRQGQSVESCVINEWLKKKGDTVKVGEVLFSYETDKASFECEATVAGVVLDVFFSAGEDVPVLTNVGVIGAAGEESASFAPQGGQSIASGAPTSKDATPVIVASAAIVKQSASDASQAGAHGISPRARNKATEKGVDVACIAGTGPHGRIIERDVLSAPAHMTSSAVAKSLATGLVAPSRGSGAAGRITAADLVAAGGAPLPQMSSDAEYTEIPMNKMRTIIASRMMDSLAKGAQLTMTASADATGLLAYRAMVKSQAKDLGLEDITIGDLLSFALARTLTRFPEVNATIEGSTIRQYSHVNIAIAVDTPRGLMVPVVRYADCLSLNELSKAIRVLALSCREGSINPDLLGGGTITLSNLGAFGIESFTPIINVPQVAILGVGAMAYKPVAKKDGTFEMRQHISLSLTIDHRALDGAPAARFLKALVSEIENIGLSLAR